ncbi:MAG TPA: lipopolysaccharide heptosyltransferase II [Chthoniobacterales bacterium]
MLDLLTYRIFLATVWVIEKLPLDMTFRFGRALGLLGYILFYPYRKLAIKNLTIAFGREKTPRQIRALARQHFQNLVANLLVTPALARLSREEIQKRLSFDGVERVLELLRSGRGVLWSINHMGNWELIAQAMCVFENFELTAVYQRLGNPHIDRYIRETRIRFGIRMLERKEGFGEAIRILREGGMGGVLIDQHAGDGGTWVPFFDRLASTSPLAALMAARSGAALVSVAVQTTGIARWKMTFLPPIEEVTRDVELTTARLNQELEQLIRLSPHEWFWVHERWKTPSPEFLLGNTKRYKRGIVLPPEMTAADLQPFEIVVRSSNWLGDAVMTVPAVRAIKRGRPDARVTVLVKQKLADFWRVIPEVDEIIPILPKDGVLSVARKLRAKKKQNGLPFDVAILFPNSMRTGLEAFLAGIPRRTAYDRQGRSFLLNQIIRDPKKVGPPEHQSLHYLRFAKQIGGDMREAAFPARPSIRRDGRLRIGLCPGAEYGPAKRWLPERFAQVANSVAHRRDCEWHLFGVAGDADIGDQIAAGIDGPVENHIGKTTLAELTALLEQCSALLTNDTGTMHLAALLGVPTIAIFGSTEPVLTGPMGAGHRVLRHQVECSPCFLRECPIDFRCMNAVAVEEVVEAVLQTIDG